MGMYDLYGYTTTTSKFGYKLGGSEGISGQSPGRQKVCEGTGEGGNNYTTGSKTATGLISQHMHSHHWLLPHSAMSSLAMA